MYEALSLGNKQIKLQKSSATDTVAKLHDTVAKLRNSP